MLVVMETHTTPIATPEQRQALRRNQQQRLRDQAEALLRAVEALEPPQTYAEAERAAKTLLAVGKVLDAVNTETRDDLPTKPAWVTTADPVVEQAALFVVLVAAEQFSLGALVFTAGPEQMRRQQRAI